MTWAARTSARQAWALASGWRPAWLPPIARREFWIVQVLVVSIALGHALNEWLPLVDLHGAEFLPVSLYLLPVVYAALTFGLPGAVPTGLWAFVLTIPNTLLWHSGFAALGELWQAGLVLGMAFFIGLRVDRERGAKRDAELRLRERRASDARYRGLFDVAADPVLVLDTEGVIVDANRAALALLDRRHDQLVGMTVDQLCPGVASALHRLGGVPESPATSDRPATDNSDDGAVSGDGPVRIDQAAGATWVEPVAVAFQDAAGRPRVLAQLRNVTLAVERQQLLESFARRNVAAREEERRRVARDLHDGPLQSLMLLWRSLDEAETHASRARRALLAAARERAEGVADELRRFSRDLRPSVLDDLGLASALKAETAAFSDRSGIDARMEVFGIADRLPSEVELTLLRICQEALRNIERHAKAKRARVTLELEPGAYRMRVADDGVGITTLARPAKLVAAGRLGIVGMQERAKLIGAVCRIARQHAWSTVVEVSGPA